MTKSIVAVYSLILLLISAVSAYAQCEDTIYFKLKSTHPIIGRIMVLLPNDYVLIESSGHEEYVKFDLIRSIRSSESKTTHHSPHKDTTKIATPDASNKGYIAAVEPDVGSNGLDFVGGLGLSFNVGKWNNVGLSLSGAWKNREGKEASLVTVTETPQRGGPTIETTTLQPAIRENDLSIGSEVQVGFQEKMYLLAGVSYIWDLDNANFQSLAGKIGIGYQLCDDDFIRSLNISFEYFKTMIIHRSVELRFTIPII
jgi:hypothetical protein